MRVAAACLTFVTLALAGTLAVGHVARSSPPAAHPNVNMVSQNLLRDGWDSAEPALSPSAVQGGGFGQLFATKVSGQVYAQPLVVDNPGSASSDVIVATETDWVYSLDGTTGAVQWSAQLGTPWSYTVASCGNVKPNVGITSTPVYDPSTGTLYVVGDVTNGNPTTTTPTVELFALDEHTGTVTWSKAISGSAVNDPKQTFNPAWERQRAGLLLMNGWIYMAFGSYCDHGPTYSGYIAGVNVANQGQSSTMWTDEAGSPDADPEAGIWMAGEGMMSDGPGRIFFTSGNGTSPPAGPGSPTPTELGDAVVRLSMGSDGSLTAQDFFSPANAPTLDANDTDFGSGAPIGLPFGTSTYPHLLVQAGKDGRVFLLDRDNLGGRSTGPNGTDKAVSMSGPYGGEWGHPGAFAGVNPDGTPADYVYYLGTGWTGRSDYLRALQFDGSKPAAPVLKDVANTAGTFGYGSSGPIVTSTGSDPASAIVWEVYSQAASGANGRLEAFNAIPRNGTLTEIWSAPVGTASTFGLPVSDNGRVYLGTRDDGSGTDTSHGVVYGFGVSQQIPVVAPQVSFGNVGVNGAGKTLNATVTATEDMQVTGATAPAAPFSMGTPSVAGAAVSFPVSLTAGQSLTIPVTFAPTDTGAASGSVQLTTNVPGFATASVPLAGIGASPGLAGDPDTLAFGANGSGDDNDPNTGPIPVGSSEAIQENITNTGTTAETITSVSALTAPFSVTGVKTGDVLQPGQSETATVTYKPVSVTGTTPNSASLTINDGDGASLTVPMTGVSVAGNGVLTPSVTTVKFATTHVGQSATSNVTLRNSGNLPVTVTGFTAPGAPFGTPVPVAKGLTIDAGDAISLPVTYTPQSPGTATNSYHITTTDGHTAAKTLTIGVSGAGAVPASGIAVPTPGGGWKLNGSARMTGTTLTVTPASHSAAGSAVYYQPLASNGLRATFRAQLSGGNGGDGMTFAMISPTDTTSKLGGYGGALGFGGMHGVAVVLGTHKDPGFPSANFVGIATGMTGSGTSAHLVFRATSTAVPNLRSGTHVIGVAVSGSTGTTRTIAVTVDGKRYLNTAVTMPTAVLPAFTAGTGLLTDVHAVSAVAVSNYAGAVPPPGGGWSFNGSAQMSGSDTQLTPATASQAGTVIYPRAVSTASSFSITFNAQIGGGTGANGMSFALLSPTDKTNWVGAKGTGFGLAGMPGFAVVLSTYQGPGSPSANYVALTSGWLNAVPTILVSNSGIGPLRTGTHSVTLTLQSGTLTVYLDGVAVLTRAYALKSALLAFTGSTSSITDVHGARNAAMSFPAWAS